MRGRAGAALLVALCAAPHLARLLGPTLVPNDGCYAHAALMIARGHEPYVDFAHVAYPFLEQLLALPLRLVGADLRVFELANVAVIGLVAAVLWCAGRALAGRAGGAAAALAWCWSLWVIHFNLLERETWAAAGVSLALLVVLRRVHGKAAASPRPAAAESPAGRAARRAAWALAGAFALAFFVKITAVAAIAGLLLHLVLAGRARLALRAGLLFAGLAAAVTGLCALVWGAPFLWQVFLYGYFRNVPDHSVVEAGRTLLLWSDPVTLLGFAAFLALGLRRLRGPAGAAACVLGAQLVYALVFSPTLWEHNLIDFAPAVALLCAALVGELRTRGARAALGTAATLAVLVAAIAFASRDASPSAAAGGAAGAPARGWLLTEMGTRSTGFGGWPRETLTKRAAFLRRHSAPDEIVATINPWWALHGDRIEFVRYWDVQAVAMGLQASLRADGLRATLAKRQGPLLLGPGLPPHDPRAELFGPYRGRELANALAYVRPLFLEALAAREIGLVVEPLAPGVLTEADLLAAGYERLVDHELGQIGWRPPGGESRPRVRALFAR